MIEDELDGLLGDADREEVAHGVEGIREELDGVSAFDLLSEAGLDGLAFYFRAA